MAIRNTLKKGKVLRYEKGEAIVQFPDQKTVKEVEVIFADKKHGLSPHVRGVKGTCKYRFVSK